MTLSSKILEGGSASGGSVKVRFLRSICVGGGVDAEVGQVMDLDEKVARGFVRNGHAVVIDHPEVHRNPDHVVDREPVRDSKKRSYIPTEQRGGSEA